MGQVSGSLATSVSYSYEKHDLPQIPKVFLDKHWPTIRELHLNDNLLSSVLGIENSVPNLVLLSLANNKFTVFPVTISNIQTLERLV